MCVCVVAQSCLTLCDPMDWSPPGSFVHGILQARVLEWVAISFSSTKTSSSIHWLKDSWADKHDFSYLNDIPSYRYTKPYAKSSLLEFVVPPCYK